MSRIAGPLWCALLPGLAFAIDPDEQARIDRDLDKAKAEVAKKYGDKKIEQQSAAERRARARDENEAAKGVLEKHGTDARSYERGRQKMNQGQQNDVRARADALKAKEEAEAKKPKAHDEVVVEKGLPPEEEARMADEELNAAPPERPAKRGRRR